MHKATRRQLWSLAALVLVAVVALFLTQREQEPPAKAPTGDQTLTVDVLVRTEKDTLVHRSLDASAPLSALSALEQTAAAATLPVGIRRYDFGRLVVSIGGHTAGADGDWTYRVNGQLMPVAAESCQLRHGDSLEFRFGKASDDSLAAQSN